MHRGDQSWIGGSGGGFFAGTAAAGGEDDGAAGAGGGGAAAEMAGVTGGGVGPVTAALGGGADLVAAGSARLSLRCGLVSWIATSGSRDRSVGWPFGAGGCECALAGGVA